MNILTIILVLIVGVILGSILGNRKKNFKLLGGKWKIAKQTREKEQHKEKILEYLKTNEKIVNDEVERLVKVSNATAERYLDELEKAGKIKQIGKTGQAVYYQLTLFNTSTG